MSSADDARLREAVMQRLENDRDLDNSGIAVAAEHAMVTLDGTVVSRGEKLRAAEHVLRVEGVKGVSNRLRIEAPPEDAATDSDLKGATTCGGWVHR